MIGAVEYLVSACMLPVCVECVNSSVHVTGEGYIQSPNFPLNYDDNTLCFYHLVVPDGFIINLTFISFVLEKAFGVHVFDKLQVSLLSYGMRHLVFVVKICSAVSARDFLTSYCSFIRYTRETAVLLPRVHTLQYAHWCRMFIPMNVFRRLEMNASKVGLKIDFKKTMILHVGHNSHPSPVTTINRYTLKICNDFLYLGVSTKTPLNVVQEKIGRAWFAIGKLRPIFISKISDANKMRLFKATVEAIAAYGLESVPMTRSLCRQIDASHRQMVRAALGITWPETISTAELTQRAKLIPLSCTIRTRRLRLVGHVIRMQSRCQTPLSTLMTTVPLNCHLRQGHGRTSTFQHNVADDLRSINCDVTSISGMTKSCFFSLVDTLEDLLAFFQIGAGLYAVGRPVQKRNDEDGQIGTIQSLPLERGASFNRFFGEPVHGPPHVAGGASGPIGGCRDESRTDNPDLDLRHVFDRNNRKTDLI